MKQVIEGKNGEKAVPIYYYDRTSYGTTSVCILVDGNKILARGVAICSPLDMFVKKIGRDKALGRAIQALSSKRANGKINPDRFDAPRAFIPYTKQDQAMMLMKHAFSTYIFKSCYQPEPTAFERGLLIRTGAKK